MKSVKLRLIILPFLVAISCSGCITASLATIGTVFGALGSAASTGEGVYKLGKLEAALACNADACHDAVLESAADLHLFVKSDSVNNKNNRIYEMTLLDDLKTPVGIHIEHRTKSLCRCRVDVGLFGSEPSARIVMQKIRTHLHELPASELPATNP